MEVIVTLCCTRACVGSLAGPASWKVAAPAGRDSTTKPIPAICCVKARVKRFRWLLLLRRQSLALPQARVEP